MFSPTKFTSDIKRAFFTFLCSFIDPKVGIVGCLLPPVSPTFETLLIAFLKILETKLLEVKNLQNLGNAHNAIKRSFLLTLRRLLCYDVAIHITGDVLRKAISLRKRTNVFFLVAPQPLRL